MVSRQTVLPEGVSVGLQTFYKTWRRACTEAGIPDRNLIHDFRRLAVRNLVRAGVPERIAMMITGHKTRAVFERYRIVSVGNLEEAAQRVDEWKQHEQLQI